MLLAQSLCALIYWTTFTNLFLSCFSLAYAEMRMVVARLIYDFDVEFAPGFQKEGWLDQKAWLIWDVPPLPVHLTPRTN